MLIDEVCLNFPSDEYRLRTRIPIFYTIIHAIRAVDPDPHSYYLLDTDPHSMCGSGSRGINFEGKNWKNTRKLVIIVLLFYKMKKIWTSSIIFNLWGIFAGAIQVISYFGSWDKITMLRSRNYLISASAPFWSHLCR